ncbi:hypothetical protein EET67_05230 [Pseudaminobacter arsenicus]|uniref:Right-handed parallel beta-helix repeat-containing protein n=1 Tax=Borborobacter arsenicus TaxID=1851146 RepID=A0A432VA26_9HYPH|nr:hypothetical protein [Pseudaminobacter arsenicus]RUM99042.1 hypothetical protein EET67_05230 [Pseudaminobacter arsenicus]
MAQTAENVFRDFVTDGVASSGANKPKKAEVRELLTGYETIINAFVSGGGTIVQGAANLPTLLNYPSLTMAWVIDPDPNLSGIYQKQGASGAGSWVRLLDLPYSFIKATNAGAGTANAIVATTSIPVPTADGGALVTVNVSADNTGPATVSFNGGPALNIISSSGNAMQAGYLTAGMQIAGFKVGSDFRLLSEAATAAMLALVEQAVLDAQAAVAAAQAAMSSVVPNIFATKAAAEAYAPAVAPDFINLAGYTFAGDGGGALYKKVAVEPTHAGKFSITLSDAVTVVWYEIAEEVVNPLMFGVNRNSAFDQTAAFQAMLDHGATEIYLPRGIYKLDGDLTCNHDLKVRGVGTLDFSAGTGQLATSGIATRVGDLSANVAKGSRTLSFTSVDGIEEFDLLCLYNPTDYSWSGHRASYREGEFCRVHSISGNTVTIYGQTYDPYTAANMQVYRVDGVSVDIDEITVIPSATASKAPIQIDYGDGVRIGRIKGSKGAYALIQIKRCYDVVIDDPSVLNNSPVVSDEYGISIANSQNLRISGPAINATRHAVALGGFDEVNCVPTREARIHNAILSNAVDIGAGDAHGNCDCVTYQGCTFRNQGALGGRNTSWLGCTIRGDKTASGIGMFGTEIVGGTYTFSDNTIISDGDGAANAYFHMVAYGPGNTPTGLQGLRDDLLLVANNNTFDVAGGVNSKLFHYDHRGNAKKATIIIDGVVVHRATALQTVAWIRDTVTTPMASNGIVVDHVFAPSGTALLLSQSSLAGVPTREMTQRGKVDFTTQANQVNAAPAQNFRYKYSKMPSATAGVSLAAGTSSGLTAGQPASPKIYELSSTYIRPAIVAPAAFTAGDVVSMHWTAGIQDV